MYNLWPYSEISLADWVEFSPYEIGMAKYGTFMTPDLFGSKFFMGTVVKKCEENPLHFLMGENRVTEMNSRLSIALLITIPIKKSKSIEFSF